MAQASLEIALLMVNCFYMSIKYLPWSGNLETCSVEYWLIRIVQSSTPGGFLLLNSIFPVVTYPSALPW